MEPGFMAALGTVTAFVAFIAVVVWAYSGRRKPDFDDAARLPLEDESRRDGTGERR